MFQVGEFLASEDVTDRPPEDITGPPEDITRPTFSLSTLVLLLLLGVSSRLEPSNTRPEGSRVGDDPKLEMRGLSKRLLPLSILLLLGLWSSGESFTIMEERLFSAFSMLFARAGGRMLLAPLRAGGRLDDNALGLLGQSRAR